MPMNTFRSISTGIFTSLLIYCIQVYGNVWGIHTYDETDRRFSNFTKRYCQKLQVLQNKVLKLETGFPSDYSTRDLINFTDQLSVHQLVAYHTLIHVHKIIIHDKPWVVSN